MSRMISANPHTEPVHHGRIELDSHADTIVFGRHCAVIHFTERCCDVSPYTNAYEQIKSAKIACAGTAWTLPALGDTYILVFNEGLWMRYQMDHILVKPNQIRHFGIMVQDNPYGDVPLYVMTEDGDFMLPIAVQGTNIMSDTRTPTE